VTIDPKLKFILLCLADALVIAVCQYTTLLLLQQSHANNLSPIVSALAFVGCSSVASFYKTSISYVGINAVKLAVVPMIVSGVAPYVLGESVALVVFSTVLALLGVIGYRVVARELLFEKRRSAGKKTLVYGAGSAGVQFVTASMQSDGLDVVGYIDDSADLIGSSIHGRTVYSSKRLEKLIDDNAVEIVVLALPSLTKSERKNIIEVLLPLPVRVVTVPTYEDLIEGKQSITQTTDISVDDLLGRDPVPPIEKFMTPRTTGKVCLVTGAGGSIGSELCRQLLKCNPKQLILLELSEPALFSIEQELISSGSASEIVCYLGSVTDETLLRRVFEEHHIDCVYHAAAYKHVPLVEANPLAGLLNNVGGTKSVLQNAVDNKCESFMLVSTDKAVRPTNIMGATKRLAEMACQLAATEPDCTTVISMVRFGNVLGSSGSVIPTFQRQIKNGGPVTLTHPEITRYFMTIPEAAQLVIQACGMAKSGDLYLLDMGSPVRIYDLAKRLIRLSGKSVNTTGVDTPGGVRIEVTGLRPGEKLYEELLINAASEPTEHGKIMRAREGHVTRAKFDEGIATLTTLLLSGNVDTFKTELSHLVTGYRPHQIKNDA